jgi:uracil-DNA glycosylase family 4
MTVSETERRAARQSLAWLMDMGADEVIAESAPNLLLADERKPEPKAQPSPPATPAARLESSGGLMRPASSDPLIGDAAALAAACGSLAELESALRRFDACPLQRTATNLVFADGNPEARVLFLGEAPGREEDEQGRPFVGRSGQLLDRMLAAIGLSRHSREPRSSAYITNVIYWRPPGNRKPTEAETLMCMPFVLRMIDLARPEFILCLGSTPTQRLLGLTDGILKTRGAWREFRGTPVLPTLHPAYLLRQPAQKRLAWRDLLSLQRKLTA